MASHNELGRRGEELALNWCTNNQFHLISKNWRSGRYEIDIIASRGNVLHFIEVKTRKGNAYGNPEESVTDTKLENLFAAADAFLIAYPDWTQVQYDVLSVTIDSSNQPSYLFIEDVYL